MERSRSLIKSLKDFKKFIPEYYGTGDGENIIKIQNMLHNKNPNLVQIADLKIGTSTITENCKNSGDEKLQRRIAKDKETTSSQYGFKFTGFTIKN